MTPTRMRLLALAVIGAGACVACGSGSNSGAPLATVITDRPTPITALPSDPRTTVAPTTPSATPSTTATPSPDTTETVAAEVVSSEYAGLAPDWYYFASPTGKFECAISVVATPIAGCHGSFPASIPEVPGSGGDGTEVQPNSIQLIAGSPAMFASLGDPKFHRFDRSASPLPYGEILTVPGTDASTVQCSVEELSGVTCTDENGHGFTISSEEYELR